MHATGVAHMDIKIENFGVDQDGKVKIFDFGSSHVFRGQDGEITWTKGTYLFKSEQ
jgi:serine/threonine protein kinase